MLVKPTGSRLWHQKYRIDGKEKLLAIGSYPEVSLAQARLARDAARALLAAGKDPSQAEQDRKREEKERRGVTLIARAGLVLRGQAVNCRRHDEVAGRWASYWHLVEEGRVKDDRTPDLRRCERLRWVP